MKTITITHFINDKDGSTPLVSVPLTNVDKVAVLCQSDFNELIESGVDPRWRLADGKVVERGKAKLNIARLITKAGKGDKIMFRDRDMLNLRRSNLIVAVGAGKANDFEKLHTRSKRLFDTAEMKHHSIEPSYAQQI